MTTSRKHIFSHLQYGTEADSSFSGGLRKLSKLVLCAVMLRGRHRGLPVAIDRAVMLPKDFTAADEDALEETRSRRMSRMGSMGGMSAGAGFPDEFAAPTGGFVRGSSVDPQTTPMRTGSIGRGSTYSAPLSPGRRRYSSHSVDPEKDREREREADRDRDRDRREEREGSRDTEADRPNHPPVTAIQWNHHHSTTLHRHEPSSSNALHFSLNRTSTEYPPTIGRGSIGEFGGPLETVQEGDITRARTRA